MLYFYLRRALRSLRRTPVLSSVMVVDMALGLAVFSVSYAAVDSQTRAPMRRSEVVFHVDWGTLPAEPSRVDRYQRVLALATHLLLPYRDAERLARHPAVSRSAKTFTSRLAVGTAAGTREMAARFCSRDLFALFELPFRYGGAWDASAERRMAPEVVLDHESNRRLFAGENSVGRTLEIDGQGFRVVGVLAPTPTRIRGYDFTFSIAPAIYLPFELFVPLGARPDYAGRRSQHGPEVAELAASADAFVQLWVELDSRRARSEYAAFLKSAAREQRPIGAGRRPMLQSAASFIRQSVPIPSGFLMFEACAFLALLACCVNLSRLLIVKFQARAQELAVQRALGATRGSVFAQHMLESVLVALAATGLGLLIAWGGLIGINAIVPDRPSEFAIDLEGLGLACAVGIGAGVLAGILPAIRMCQAAPAAFLRLQ